MNDNTYISVKNLSWYVKKKKILSDINFDLEKGNVLGVVGPNGSGK